MILPLPQAALAGTLMVAIVRLDNAFESIALAY
jgi:hypothetical protein